MKRAWIRIAGIGIFHTMLYMVLVPIVIYPRFGARGLEVTIVASIIVSVVVMGSLGVKRKKNSVKGDKKDDK